MKENQNTKHLILDIGSFLRVVKNSKKILLLISTIVMILAITFYLLTPTTYKSEATLSPRYNPSEGLSIPKSISGLASIAGLGGLSGGSDNLNVAIATIRSRKFALELFETDAYEPIYFGGAYWNKEEEKIIYRPQIYNEGEKNWLDEDNVPTEDEIVNIYREIMTIEYDEAMSVVRLSILSPSPKVSQKLAEDIILKINKDIKAKNVMERKKYIEYLKSKIDETTYSEMRSIFYSLIEEQNKEYMLAEITDDYVFKVIDPPYFSDVVHSPSKLIFLASALVAAFFLCFIYVLISGYKKIFTYD